MDNTRGAHSHVSTATQPRSRTRATPHFGQMALALAGLFAQIHHISAHRLGGHWDLGEVLLVVTEVHGEKHLPTERERETAAVSVHITGFTF